MASEDYAIPSLIQIRASGPALHYLRGHRTNSWNRRMTSKTALEIFAAKAPRPSRASAIPSQTLNSDLGRSDADQSNPNQPTIQTLHRKLAAIRTRVAQEGAATLGLWRETLGGCAFTPAAENLACYLALRRRDLSALQPALSAYGLSSLGRSEARVLTALDALLATLARLAGTTAPPYPGAAEMEAGMAALLREQERFFGRDPGGQHTRIMVTLPTEAASDAMLVRRLVEAGMSCARINCAHDSPVVWSAMIAKVRAAARQLGRDCRILMDIAGPKCRIETVHVGNSERLRRGDRIVLVKHFSDARKSDAAIVTISFPEILDMLRPDAAVWIDDGKIGARVVSNDKGRVVLEIVSARAKGERLRVEKGINFPDTPLSLPALGPADLKALDFVALNADLVGFSFVQTPADIALLDRELHKRRKDKMADKPPQPVVLKIETRRAVENLPQLIVAAAATRPVAVMIARGDLAVELGFARMSEIQEEMLWLCDAAHVPVIWATQVLDNFVAEGRPSRAEATDAAMSQRAECVMLNKGPFLVEGIGFLKDILRRMDRHQAKKFARFAPLKSWSRLEMPAS
jgi:pyruvate kinase